MTMLSLAEVKSHLSELVGRVNSQHERVTVTVHGKPSAVLIAPEDLESLEETIAILSDPDTLSRLAVSPSRRLRGRACGWRGGVRGAARPGHDRTTPAGCVTGTAARYTLIITPTARRQLAQHLPEAVAFAAHQSIVGALLDNPQRVRKRLHAPLDDRHSAR